MCDTGLVPRLSLFMYILHNNKIFNIWNPVIDPASVNLQ